MSDDKIEYLWQWYAFGVRDELLDAGNAWAHDEKEARQVADTCMRPLGTRVEKFQARKIIDRVRAPGDIVYVTRSKE